MKKICVVTSTRAEYGLLKNIIRKLKKSNEFEVNIVTTGMHLSPEFGFTYKEIEEDGFEIDEKIEILLSSDTSVSISKSMGLALISFAEYFSRKRPDILIILGDRYEMMSICCAAMNERIPIAHLYGGETTEGAIDECVRHSISKMSYLHFTSTEEYRKRVIQLGESPNRVFNVGAMGIENILNTDLLTKSDLEDLINFNLDKKYAIVTFHSVTLERNTVETQFKNILDACDKYKNMNYIFTKSNCDEGGRIINNMIDEYVSQRDNAISFESLGMLRYLSAVKYSAMVIGNSSSGIVEVPAFKIPTINIGDRQKGRLQGDTVINCNPDFDDICLSIEKAQNEEFKNKIKNSKNIFGDGNTSDKIVKEIAKFLKNDEINLKKKFYDLM
ncbi:UDP-N-acetylglucosamine 2-epimerase [Clostridium butyricum]|uniref:UDP-N-acetylglucosamine 2-epimerase n=1 Tax=Clostridium butyricum TaxID=1492 RepID=UPI00136C4BBD|nr:UDP-N-acetylglucosamine 2-epimerase [Clostridium butyricum]MZI81037.1 UDP-N-acetylglucosamine 2-epimerase (hydrolyzing) [Clostridium butyricum]